MAISQSANELLAALPAADFDLLRPHLYTIDLKFGQVLVEAGAPLAQLVFPHGGIVSSVVGLTKADVIEVASIGRNGVIGSEAVHQNVAATGAVVRYPTSASAIDVMHFRYAVDHSAVLRGLMLRYQWSRSVEAEQIAACNAAHSAEARLCRRLLQSRDMAGSDCMQLGQDLMARMLGVKRNTISLIAHALQQQGLIRYSRGRLAITDPDGLMQRACGCYRATRGGFAAVAVDRQPSMVVPRLGSDYAASQSLPS
ncbi:Crp/Fnr family transcriptional regulator [Rhodopseudomonas palustris]|uniref:Putative transcriptional regulator, Crp/Fnr family n=1 Tax=Rhodopseudomonas palustris (strain DX-1) TaxID=652103 RepID=E6VNF4_RHOPX|nr:Crp/Fnr family transcriptional regulator [Rhodopseudomonas palustris]QDL98074.1 Crp/Fnr family transcriptional regulator [Rhodopseudomonas palustris]